METITGYEFHFEVVWQNIGTLLKGASVTLTFSIATIFFGSILGGIACYLTLSKSSISKKPAQAYIQFIRGTPLLVQLLWIYYGLPLILGIALPAIVSGIIGMSLNAGAYISEIFRSGILAVEQGQFEAARSIGLSRTMTFRRIVAPQAFRIILPPLANMFIGIVKDTSLVSVIAVSELVRRGQLLSASTFRTMEIFTGVAVIYFCMTYILARIAVILEKKYSRGIFPQPA